MRQTARLLVWVAAVALLSACGSAQSRLAAYLKRGEAYYNTGNYDKARVEFRNAAQIDPKNAEARVHLGRVAEQLGDLRGAVEQYQAAIYYDPKQVNARASLGRIFLRGGAPNKALELVEPGLTSDPHNALLLTVRGSARAQLGQLAEALEDARQAVTAAPDDPFAIALLASIYKKQSNLGAAVQTVQSGLTRLPNSADLRAILADLNLAQGHPADTEAQLRAIVALEPKVLPYRYRLAGFYLQQKNVDAAEKTLRSAIDDFPADVGPKIQLVEFLVAQRGVDPAIAEIDRILAANSRDDSLALGMADLLTRVGKPDRAEVLLRDIIKRAGTDPAGLTARDRLAALRLMQNDTAGASALLAEVLKKNARDAGALIMRGNIELGAGDATSAITDLRAVLRDQPNDIPVVLVLARAYQQNDQPDLAEETLRGAVQLAPKNVDTRLALAQVLLAAGKLDQAAELLGQVTQDAPKSIPALQLLCQVQATQKHFDDALATAQNIDRVSPKSGLGSYLEGSIEEAQGKIDSAAKYYARALEREPDAGEPLVASVRLDVRRKQFAPAMARLDSVIARLPNNVLAGSLRAELLMTEGQLDPAITAYRKLVPIAPGSPLVYLGLARAQQASNHLDDAAETLRQGIDKTHDATSLVSELSGLYLRQGRVDDSIALYEQVLQQNPHSIFAVNNLALLLVDYHQDAATIARAQKLAEQLASSSQPQLIDTRGWVRFKSGDYRGAESLLQQAVEKMPQFPEFRYHLGMAQFRSGEEQAAEQSLEAALNAGRPFAGMDEARTTLAQLKKIPAG
jgi:tetratricopeptide (TPR) repeat protein